MTTPGGPPQQQPGQQGNPNQQSNETQQLPVQLFGPHTDAPTGQQRAASVPPQGPPQGAASGGWGPPQHHQPAQQVQPGPQAQPGQQAQSAPQSAPPGRPAQQSPPAQGWGAPQQPPRQGNTPYQYGPPGPQYGTGPQSAQQRGGSASSVIWLLGIVSVLAVVLGLSVDEDGKNAWGSVHAWGGLAIVGAALTLAPVVMSAGSRQRSWQVSACGAGALILFWVLFVLPGVGSNTSLATTVGVAAGAVAAWIASGRDASGRDTSERDSSGPGRRDEHTW